MVPTNAIQFKENKTRKWEEADEEEAKLSQEYKEFIFSLPKEKGWVSRYTYLFEGFWFHPVSLQGFLNFQKHFQAKDSDIIVATVPKSGTTWLKALTFAIVNRHRITSSMTHPLLTSTPHQLVPFIELNIYNNSHDQVPNLSNMTEPRLFATHLPSSFLEKSIMKSNSKIIYICRNPLDTFVSSWIFFNKIRPEYLPELTLEEALDMYCKGITGSGPCWNHMLGYWKESIAKPNKVLFLKYEDLKEDVNLNVKRVAEFLGYPFTEEEESSGVIENIINLCSFEKMKELEVNKSGLIVNRACSHDFFRKAEIGDWVNYISPEMAERLSEIIEEKLNGSGLSFRMHY